MTLPDDFSVPSADPPSAPGSHRAPMRRRDDPRMHTVEMAALVDEEAEQSAEPLTLRRTMLFVALGGALGAMLRSILSLLMPATFTPTLIEFPWATGIANVLGCLIIGIVTGLIEAGQVRARWVHPFFATGVCGGFTTLSLLILEGAAMLGADFPIQAAEYVGATMLLCLGAVVLGLELARRFGGRVFREVRELRARVEERRS